MNGDQKAGASDWITRAVTLRSSGDLEGELAALEQAPAIDPEHGFALGERPAVLAHLARYEDAVRGSVRTCAARSRWTNS